MKKHLLLLFCLTSFIFAHSQTKKFSTEPDIFLEDMIAFMGTSSVDKKEIDQELSTFKEVWKRDDKFTDDRRKEYIKLANQYLYKRAKPTPHFIEFIKTTNLLINNERLLDEFDSWMKGMSHTIKKKNIKYALGYTKKINAVIQKNQLFKSTSTEWKTDATKFRIIYDNVPVIEFDETNLTCFSKRDSSVIFKTKGLFYPIDNIWKGEGGKILWTRAGYGENDVFARLSDYKIELKSSKYTADSVMFTNKIYYNVEMLGSLEEKIIADITPERASYPRFESYKTLFEIKDIYPGINYKGGFSMHGSKFIGSGNKYSDAHLYVLRGDSIVMSCSSKMFVFKKDQITARNTAISIYLQQDSLYHPGLLFKYYVKNREISLIRNDDPQSMSRSPYYNTYHKIDMDFEHLNWNLTKNEMKMGSLKGAIVSKANFESANYFRESKYHKLGMYDRMHPLIALKKYARTYGSEELYAQDLAGFMRLPITEVRHLCLNLSYNGIIDYDIETDKIKIKERLYNYLKARVGRIDYDVISFSSEHDMIGLENAALNITNLDLKLYGVARIAVSDSQNVIIYPRGRQLIVKKNRDFEFDGVIEAGLFTFFGQNFYFSYDDFKIDLQNIDSLKIKVMSHNANEYGMKELVDIQNVIENITGDLLIDDPLNKSSVKHFPEYPIFNSKQKSFVYYDYPFTQDGVYSRDSFFFAVDPYKVDSLNRFTTQGLSFSGEFVSANIMPTFQEDLKVQKDYSLGFTRVTGPDGYEIYKGKGKFYDTINLSNFGLVGTGTITYLSSSARSDQFVFLPDSVNGIASEYKIEQKTDGSASEFPAVNASDVQIHWEPYNDSWKSTETDSALAMYGGQAVLKGGTEFTPEGLNGWGKFKFGNAVINSNSFHFKEQEVLADTSEFNLLVDENNYEDLAFKTTNVASHVSFEDKTASFKSNDEKTVVQFPKNKYICYLDRFSWDMTYQEIKLGALASSKVMSPSVVSPHFISVHPDQDTLNFVAPQATYDLNKYVIKSEKVKSINVADAVVYPDEKGEVTVNPGALLDPISNAKITADRINRFHNIYDATVQIEGRFAYKGTGKYDFEDSEGNKQTIEMREIGVDTAQFTFASGAIAEPDSFRISPQFAYQGKVRLHSQSKELSYDGATKLATSCDTMPMHWVAFKGSVDPKNIFIPIPEDPKDINGKRVYASIYITKDSSHIYSCFLGKRKRFNDVSIVSANGYLHFDTESKKYIISNKAKIADRNRGGNILTFHKDFCNMYGEGKLNLGVDLGQVKLDPHGSISHNIMMDKVNLETMMATDFFFPNELMNRIADTLINNIDLKGVDMGSKIYASALTSMLGEEEAHKRLTEVKLYGSMKRLPETMKKTIVFSQLNLQWNTKTSSYRSIGKIGISNILDKQIHKLVDGYVEIVKRRTGDAIHIYLELSKNDWYFFSYTREVMQAISSDENFNLFIENMKEDKKKMKTPRREAAYEFYLSSDTRKNIFLRDFKSEKAVSNDSDIEYQNTGNDAPEIPVDSPTIPQESPTIPNGTLELPSSEE